MAEKLNPFYQLLKTEEPINIASEVRDTFDSVNKALNDSCQLALKQPIPGKQIVLMTDASFRSAGYALMVEDNLHQKIESKRKTCAPWPLAQKVSPLRNKFVQVLERIFLALYMAIHGFAHFLWKATKP